MNNKGSLIINGVLAVAIIILFMLQFSDSPNSNVSDIAVVEEKEEAASLVK